MRQSTKQYYILILTILCNSNISEKNLKNVLSWDAKHITVGKQLILKKIKLFFHLAFYGILIKPIFSRFYLKLCLHAKT